VAPRDWSRSVPYLKAEWSPEQIVGRLRRLGQLWICQGTIYKHVWQNRAQNGPLSQFLRGGGRPIGTRPAQIEARQQLSQCAADTIAGGRDSVAALTLVGRKATLLPCLRQISSRLPSERTRR